MSTDDRIRQHAERFEQEAPESLPERLQWWSTRLGIDRVRLLRLMGMTHSEALRRRTNSLVEIVAEREEGAEQADDMLGRLLAFFEYDLDAFCLALHHPIGPEHREASRVKRRPGEVFSLPYYPRPEQQAGLLLNEIITGGPRAMPALLAYLSRSESRS